MPISPRNHPTMPPTPTANSQSRLAANIAAHAPATSLPVLGVVNGSGGGHAGRAGRVFHGARPTPKEGPIAAAEEYLFTYMVLPDGSALVIAAWVIAAWLAELWDRFGHLAITSPEKRCGKTTLLELLFQIVPRPRYTTNISPAALYRVVEKEHPTLLMDESQSISRRGSEASEVMRELLNAGISKKAKVTRCGGARYEDIEEFSVYGPKVFAMIGEPDAVLSDRCLPVALQRKTKEVRRCRDREVEEAGKAVQQKLEQWAVGNGEEVGKAYATAEPFDIENDRMADLLMPLQAVLAVAAPDRLKELEEYAKGLDERDREADRMEPGPRLLAACREIFAAHRERLKVRSVFFPTKSLIAELVKRTEEPWATFTRGKEITPEALANLLRKYSIRPELNAQRTERGYISARFEDAWSRYLPPPSEKPSIPSSPSGNGGDA